MREKDWRDEIQKGDILSTLAGDREVLGATHRNGFLVAIRLERIRGGGGTTVYVRSDLRCMGMQPKWGARTPTLPDFGALLMPMIERELEIINKFVWLPDLCGPWGRPMP